LLYLSPAREKRLKAAHVDFDPAPAKLYESRTCGAKRGEVIVAEYLIAKRKFDRKIEKRTECHALAVLCSHANTYRGPRYCTRVPLVGEAHGDARSFACWGCLQERIGTRRAPRERLNDVVGIDEFLYDRHGL
jgi:hypothetical protein